MNELFSVDAVTKVHVSRLDEGFGLSIGSTYVILSDKEADRLGRHFLFGEPVTEEPEVDTEPEEVVDSGTEEGTDNG